MDSRMYDRIHEGMDVFDRDADKIGKAGETIGEFFNVDAGLLGPATLASRPLQSHLAPAGPFGSPCAQSR